MLHKDKVFAYKKRWNALCRQQKDLNYQFALFARDLRAEYPKGDRGDTQFMKFCVQHLTDIKTEQQAKGLLTQAFAATILGDEATFKAVSLGDTESTTCARFAALDKKEQLATLEAAKLQNMTVTTVMRQRAIAQGKLPPPSPRVSHYDNARTFARFIKRACKSVPKDVEMLLKHYPELESVPMSKSA